MLSGKFIYFVKMNIFGGGNTTFGASASTNFNAMKDIEVCTPFYGGNFYLLIIYEPIDWITINS